MRMKYGNSWKTPLFHASAQVPSAEPEAPSPVPQFISSANSSDVPFYNKVENYYANIYPTLTQREAEVYENVRTIQPCTMHAVAKAMGRELNTISGRFSSLVEKSYLKITSKTSDNKSIYVTTKTNGEQTQ